MTSSSSSLQTTADTEFSNTRLLPLEPHICKAISNLIRKIDLVGSGVLSPMALVMHKRKEPLSRTIDIAQSKILEPQILNHTSINEEEKMLSERSLVEPILTSVKSVTSSKRGRPSRVLQIPTLSSTLDTTEASKPYVLESMPVETGRLKSSGSMDLPVVVKVGKPSKKRQKPM